MELTATVRGELRQKWERINQLLERVENANMEELTMAYFLVDALAEKVKHGLRHRIEREAVVGLVTNFGVPTIPVNTLPGRLGNVNVGLPGTMGLPSPRPFPTINQYTLPGTMGLPSPYPGTVKLPSPKLFQFPGVPPLAPLPGTAGLPSPRPFNTIGGQGTQTFNFPTVRGATTRPASPRAYPTVVPA